MPPQPQDLPDAHKAHGVVHLRFEDITQAGRLRITTVPLAAQCIWQKAYAQQRLKDAANQGILPILTRLKLWVNQEEFSVHGKMEAEGVFQLAKDEESGRLFLNMWSTLYGYRGSTYGQLVDGAGERVVAARYFAEHIFTKPFAPPGNRRVSALDGPWTPKTCYNFQPHHYSGMRPEGVQPLSDGPLRAAPFVFGLTHTDSNQHVNSLVYPRVFEEALLQRIVELEHDDMPTAPIQATFFEVAWRKPFFAGQIAEINVEPFIQNQQIGAVGTLFPKGANAEDAHCYATIILA